MRHSRPGAPGSPKSIPSEETGASQGQHLKRPGSLSERSGDSAHASCHQRHIEKHAHCNHQCYVQTRQSLTQHESVLSSDGHDEREAKEKPG